MPGGIGRAFSVAIAAQFQALGMLGFAWLAGQWLNERYPQSFNWYAVTFLVSVLAIAQTFYVMIRHFMQSEQKADSTGEPSNPNDDLQKKGGR